MPFLRTKPTQMPGKYGTVGNIIPNHFWDGAETDQRWKSGVFLGESTDSGAASAGLMRAGLLIAKVFGDADNKFFVPWNPVGDDGSQIIRGVLKETTDLLKSGSAADHRLMYMAGGIVRPEKLIVAGESATGLSQSDFEHLARLQMRSIGFEFSESDWQDRPLDMQYAPVQIDKDEAYTILEKESGSLFTNLGASASVALTLPTPKRGLAYEFIVLEAQPIVITAPTADTLIAGTDVAADSVTLLAADIGVTARARVVRTAADTYKWFVETQLAAVTGASIQT